MRLAEFTFASPLARQRAFETLQDYGLTDMNDADQMWDQISEHFERYCNTEGFLDIRGDTAFFGSPYSVADGSPLSIRVKRNEVSGRQPWFGLFFVERAPWIPYSTPVLHSLADMALPEPWGFGEETDHTILKNYLNGTLSRAYKLGKSHFLRSSDGRLVAFNTGLLNRNTLKDIFVLAKADPATPYDAYAPVVCVEDDTRFIRSFDGKIPEVVTFFRYISDVVYDTSLPCRVSDEHIAKRTDRLFGK